MTSSRPYWQDIILERTAYHKEHLINAQDVADIGSADQHAVVLQELTYLQEALGIEVEV